MALSMGQKLHSVPSLQRPGTGMSEMYTDPDFRQAETTLRRRARPQLADFKYRLRNQGLSALDAEKVSAGANISAQNQFGDLVTDQLHYQQARAEARRARRKSTLGSVLGTALGLIPGISQARALGNLAKSASGSTAAEPELQNPADAILGRTGRPIYEYADPYGPQEERNLQWR